MIEIRNDETEQFLQERVFILVLLFGVLISESFDEYGDASFELFCVDQRDTFDFNLGVESLFQKVEEFLDEGLMF